MMMRATVYSQQHWVAITELGEDRAIANGGMFAQEYVAAQEANPVMAAALARVRAKVGEAAVKAKGGGLAALRLRAGLSQQQLAEKMKTHQPSVARWERTPGQMNFATIQQMAEALGVAEQAIFDAQRPAVQAADYSMTSPEHA